MSEIVHQGKHDRVIVGEPLNPSSAYLEGVAMRELRADKGLNMRHMAAMLGIMPTKLSDAENGRLSLEETEALHNRVKGL